MRSHPDFKVYLALAAVCFFWGTTYLGIRMALESLPPLMLVGLRYTISGSLLLLVAFFAKAHLLSGTSASLGAKRVSEAARELELLGQKGLLTCAVESFEVLLAAIDELKPYLIELTHVPAA